MPLTGSDLSEHYVNFSEFIYHFLVIVDNQKYAAVGLSNTKMCNCLDLIIRMRYIFIKEIVKYSSSKLITMTPVINKTFGQGWDDLYTLNTMALKINYQSHYSNILFMMT